MCRGISFCRAAVLTAPKRVSKRLKQALKKDRAPKTIVSSFIDNKYINFGQFLFTKKFQINK
jgi:hypothetical protein